MAPMRVEGEEYNYAKNFGTLILYTLIIGIIPFLFKKKKKNVFVVLCETIHKMI
jgi:hypothetical protein